MKTPTTISHDEFLVSYQNGRIGCAVSTLATMRLFFAGQIHNATLSKDLVLWLLGFLTLVVMSAFCFVYTPVPLALLVTILLMAIYALGLVTHIAETVIAHILTDKEFFEFAQSRHILWFYSDGEGRLPKPQKVIPIRSARRNQR